MLFFRKNLEKHLRNEKNSRIFAFPIWKSWSSRNENMLGSIAQLVQSVCLTSRGSGVRLPLLPLRKHFGISGLLFFCSSGTDSIRFLATCALKRFPRTSLSKFTMSCANRAFLLTRESSRVVESKLHPSHDGLSAFHVYLVPIKRFKRY